MTNCRNIGTVLAVFLVMLAGCKGAESVIEPVSSAANVHDNDLQSDSFSPSPPNPGNLTLISVDSADRLELIATMSGHTDRIWNLAISGDGRYLFSASWDRTVLVWDLQTEQVLYSFNIPSMDLNAIALSPDGRYLATAFTIWDLANREVFQNLGGNREIPGHAAFSPDSTLLAVQFPERAIALVDVASGERVDTMEEVDGAGIFFGIEFSPDGRLLAAAGRDGTVRLWDVDSGQTERVLVHGSEIHVHDIAFSPDGNWLASVGIDGRVLLWDVESGQLVQNMFHGAGLYGVGFSPDSRLVASGGGDRTVKVWDVLTGECVRVLRQADEVTSVVFSPDGTLIISGGYDNLVYIWGIPE